jgi:hypothetical protein
MFCEYNCVWQVTPLVAELYVQESLQDGYSLTQNSFVTSEDQNSTFIDDIYFFVNVNLQLALQQ